MTYEGDQYNIHMFSSLSGVRLIFSVSPCLNILCISKEKRYYTENTNQYNHDVQFLHTFASELTMKTYISRSRAFRKLT